MDPEIFRKKRLKELQEIIKRANPVECVHLDNRIVIITSRAEPIVFDINGVLWDEYVKDPVIPIKELNPNDPQYSDHLSRFRCSENLDSKNWVEMNAGELFEGKKIDIMIEEREYPVTLNKDMLGMRLKKNEFVNISYRVAIIDKHLVLSLKKKWDDITDKNKNPIPNTSFTMIRNFLIV